MFKNYFLVAHRNLVRNKSTAMINIGGLTIGMAAAMLIGLWIFNELSFDTYHKNYNRIAQVMQHEKYNGSINTGKTIPLPLDAELRKSYSGDFKHIVLSSSSEKHVFNFHDKNIGYSGRFMGDEAPDLLSLTMIAGTTGGLKDPSSLLISQSVATALFGDADPINQIIKLDNADNFRIAGVYENLPSNSSFSGMSYIGPWDYYIHLPGNERSLTDWRDNSLFMYVQIADNANMEQLSTRIKNLKLINMSKENQKSSSVLFLQPMYKWHLYSDFKNGVNVGGAIQYVWLFGIVGIFILLLACINFMNLSTARSEKRAKEVGIRKAIGSVRAQLIKQFFCESLLTTFLAFIIAMILVWLALPWFSQIAGKKISLLWDYPLFWLTAIGFTLFTGLLAGSYPAFYLSGFNPVRVLKGTFRAGRLAVLPRKVLTVVQFTVSVILIVSTIVVFRQIRFARNRPVGYNQASLIDIAVTNNDLHDHFAAFRNELLHTGAVSEIAESSSPVTGVNNNRGDVSWAGKDPSFVSSFGNINVSFGYGRTVGWQLVEGRDFSEQLLTDSSSAILNETAVRNMGLKDPVGEVLRVGKRNLSVIGVVKDMVMESPYEPVKQTIFRIGANKADHIIIHINPAVSAYDALKKIEAVCKIYSPSVPFSYRFADEAYDRKFIAEERVGSLARSFAALAIFISCLGLFGMASFMAEQRVKELGVRKVLGATVAGLWGLMSKDFVQLIIIALLIAIPVAYYFMHDWLQHYTYRSALPWWIFGLTAIGTILLTLITVSYQSIKAALANPVRSLRNE